MGRLARVPRRRPSALLTSLRDTGAWKRSSRQTRQSTRRASRSSQKASAEAHVPLLRSPSSSTLQSSDRRRRRSSQSQCSMQKSTDATQVTRAGTISEFRRKRQIALVVAAKGSGHLRQLKSSSSSSKTPNSSRGPSIWRARTTKPCPRRRSGESLMPSIQRAT